MSDPPGMKRSHDDSTSPHPKRHNTEQSNIPRPSLSKKHLSLLKQILQLSLNPDHVDEHERPSSIYTDVSKVLTQEGKKSIVDLDTFRSNISLDEKAFYDIVRRAADEGASEEDLQAVVNHKVFWTNLASPRQFTVAALEPEVPKALQDEATENSWNVNFADQAPVRGLESHIGHQLQIGRSTTDTTPPYGRYCSILQSSGMGKSRLLDEFSKTYFMIPINLRGPDTRGYPPADHEVRDFLTEVIQVPERVELRMKRFLVELFIKAAETLENMDWDKSKDNHVARFREYMSEGQSMDSAGANRVAFYEDVVARARVAPEGSSASTNITSALQRLQRALNCGGDINKGRIHAKNAPTSSNQFVDIFVTFDEAHTLSERRDNLGESHFIILRRVLSSHTSDPLFCFFLSTTGKVTQFIQPRGQDPSDRIRDGNLSTPHPYILLGFDQLMKDYKLFSSSEPPTLHHVTSIEFAVRLGRPLWGTRYENGQDSIKDSILGFAIQKLLCGVVPVEEGKPKYTHAHMYAVLSQRLALDISTPQYLFNSANPFDGVRIIQYQIENHLRVCVAVGKGIESLRAIAASEPILSEAACHIMLDENKPFPLLEALSKVLTGFNIHRGDRGELLVACFFTCARDKVIDIPRDVTRLCNFFSVNALFKSLFTNNTFKTMEASLPSLSSSEAEGKEFQTVFAKAMMHFNHVIKPQEQKLLTRPYLLLFMARGAAALGANCQPGFDAVYPFLYDSKDERLNVKNVGFVIVQVKNDANVSPSDDELFKKMDPFGCSLLNNSDKVNGRFPIPIIRLVFLIAKKKHFAVTRKTYNSPSDGATSLGEDGRPLFTSYDYVCTGISSSVLNVIKESEEEHWNKLADADQRNIFHGVSAPDVLRSQLPGCGSDVGHFRSWVHDSFFQESR